VIELNLVLLGQSDAIAESVVLCDQGHAARSFLPDYVINPSAI
jgi:hypothetical protein